MILDTTQLRHVSTTAPAPSPAPARDAWQPGRRRRVTRSPAEEFAHRARAHPPTALPDALVALILQHQRRLKVGRHGLRLEIAGQTLTYWHADSAVCTRHGTEVLVTLDLDEPAAVHVLTDDGRYLETIPLREKTAWFSKESFAAKAENDRFIKKTHERLTALHAPTARAEAERTERNRDAIQATHAFPQPNVARQPAPALPDADEIVAAASRARRLAAASDRRTAATNRLAAAAAPADPVATTNRLAAAARAETPAAPHPWGDARPLSPEDYARYYATPR